MPRWGVVEGEEQTWRELIAGAVAAGCSLGDSRRIAAEVLGCSAAELVRELDSPAAQLAARAFISRSTRRAAGEPLQYVLGSWGFRELELAVDRRALIPRPETEAVAGAAIGAARSVVASGRHPVVVDLGTGSGAIALAVATEVAHSQVWATDASSDALALASANLVGCGRNVARRVRLACGSWWNALESELRGRIDVAVSNPPYVPSGEALPAEVVEWEPTAALFAGLDGLDAYRALIPPATEWLAPGGWLVLEVGDTQADEVGAICARFGLADVAVEQDLSGRDRVVVARAPGKRS